MIVALEASDGPGLKEALRKLLVASAKDAKALEVRGREGGYGDPWDSD